MGKKHEELSEEEIDQRIEKFRKVVRYRKYAGIVLSTVGLVVLGIGLTTPGDVFLKINGGFCLAYGAFMCWQSAKYAGKLGVHRSD